MSAEDPWNPKDIIIPIKQDRFSTSIGRGCHLLLSDFNGSSCCWIQLEHSFFVPEDYFALSKPPQCLKDVLPLRVTNTIADVTQYCFQGELFRSPISQCMDYAVFNFARFSGLRTQFDLWVELPSVPVHVSQH